MNNELIIDYANKRTRFLNLVIDSIIFWILHIILILTFGDHIKGFIGEDSALKNFAFFLFEYFLYNFIFELAFSRTPGKLLTGTKVIDEKEGKPNFKSFLIRNVCRLIPFDAFSFIFITQGWHDSFSKTTVINT